MPTVLRTIAGLVIALTIVACSQEPVSEVEHRVERAAIVAGQAEPNFEAVGALTYFRGGLYFGTFCTGTLIAPQWVLTSASCIDQVIVQLSNAGDDFDPSRIQFFLGTDSGSPGSPPANQETFYNIDQVFSHPNWDQNELVPTNNIGLIHLTRAVEDVAPLPLQRSPIARLRGSMLTYVGFGVVNAELGTGRGDKRSTTLQMGEPLPLTFSSSHVETGVCNGDGGGPGLLQVDGEWHVVGVTSTFNEDAPACLTYSIQTRVDAFISWIDTMLGQGADCNSGRAPCGCDAACGADGVCDEYACGMGSCSVVFNCARACPEEQCIYGCLSGGTPAARLRYTNVARCIEQFCAPNDNNCITRRCFNERTICLESGPIPDLGDDDCWTVYQCTRRCNNSACRDNCLALGAPNARLGSSALDQCRTRNCGHLNNPEAKDACAYAACDAYFRRCLPPDDCDLGGGDCDADEACFENPWGSNYCLPTAGLPMGALCNPAEPQCTDGVLCVAVGNQTNCRASCRENADCMAAGTECRIREDLPDNLGICVPCADDDQDGACNVDDCAPNDNTIGPGLPDLCHNLVDNDCDDIVDEGCDIPDLGVEDAAIIADAGQDAGSEDAAPSIDEGVSDATMDAGVAEDSGARLDMMAGSDAALADTGMDAAVDMAIQPDAQNTDDMNLELLDTGSTPDDAADASDASDATDAELEEDTAVFKTGRIRGGSVVVACDCAQGANGPTGLGWCVLLLLGRVFFRRRD